MIVETLYQAETGKWYALVSIDATGTHYDLKFDAQPTEQDIADRMALVMEVADASNQ